MMMTKILAAGVAALAIATAPALAQDATTTPPAPGAAPVQTETMTPTPAPSSVPGPLTFQQEPQPNQVLASDLMNANIYGSDGNSIGSINDVVLDQQGQIQAVVVGVGGFLGIGRKDVAVPFRSLQISQLTSGITTEGSDANPGNRIMLSVSRDQLQEAPEFKTTSAAERARSSSGATPAQ